MPVLQHYYTSYINTTNGSAGFQVKAMSPGLSAEDQALIAQMIAYRVPPTTDEYALDQHPIALRYFYKNERTSIFLCSQSNGRDENGRPGNFFAHSLVLPPDTFKITPPILFWKSSFWQKADRSQRTELPTIETFDIDPEFDTEQIWSFLASPQRQRYFYALMCAVIHMERTKRRIVIIDAAEQVACWIAALSCMLPPVYRPMLSFATYHHDPYQAQFMITGTTSDSQFHGTQDEYLSYFVLDPQKGQISTIEDSDYARLAVSALNEELFDALLLPFFTEYSAHFSSSTSIDQELDLIARYYQLRTQKTEHALDATDLRAIAAILTQFERPIPPVGIEAAFSQKETEEELNQLATLLTSVYTASQDGTDNSAYTLYRRIMKIFQDKHIINEHFLVDEIQYVTRCIYKGQVPSSEEPTLAALIKTYGKDAVQKVFCHPDYVRQLTMLVGSANAQQQQRLWSGLGAYLEPSLQNSVLLQRSLVTASELLQQGHEDDLHELLQAMSNAMYAQILTWLRIAIQLRATLPENQRIQIDPALKRFYYTLVLPINKLQERQIFREIIQTIYSDIHLYEMQEDLRSHTPSDGSTVLTIWIKYARSHNIAPSRLVEAGIKQMSQQCSAEQWLALLPSLLGSEIVTALTPATEQRLVTTMMDALSLSQFSPQHVALYQKYYQFPALSAQTRTILSGLIGMSDGRLDAQRIRELNLYMHSLKNATDYQREAEAFIVAHCTFSFSKRVQSVILSAMFVERYSAIFWQVYQEAYVLPFLTTPDETKDAIHLLSFWFQARPQTFEEPYAVQYFFFSLSEALLKTQQIPSFTERLQPFLSMANKESWYPLLKEHLVQKSMFSVAGQVMVSQFQKLRSLRFGDKQKEAQQAPDYARLVQDLFHERQVVEQHTNNITSLYGEMSREHFWQLYWEHFEQSTLSAEINQTLKLFSFWFDQSFTVCADNPALPQEFFLNLPQTLQALSKDRRHFSKIAWQMREKASQSTSTHYSWYPLLQEYFSS